MKETDAEDAPVYVKEKAEDAPVYVEKATYSGEQDLHEEGKTEKQKQRGNEKNVAACNSFSAFRY